MAPAEQGRLMLLWWIARGTGVAALVAFTVATAAGALTSGSRGRSSLAVERRFLVQMLHRSAAVTGLVLLLVHAVTIVADAYVDVSATSTVLPFTSAYEPFAVGLGSLALWAFVATSVSGAVRGRLASSAPASRGWRAVHCLAYVGWALSIGHGFLAGTDSGTPWLLAVYAACVALVAAAVAQRLRAARTHARSPLTRARQQSAQQTGSTR
ncbi:ferric reductase [Solicola sp. PLA-1-18]|uniref:ferric reductase n=1 Tax=Solicola sp. PLA-1-18 TaxID=3380532 RepID=UPI003B79FD28